MDLISYFVIIKKCLPMWRHINMKDITDRDYTHANRFCKKFQIKNLDEYHDLYI